MEADSTTPWGWIVGALGAIGSLLSGTIAKLYHGQVKLYEDRIAGLEGQVCSLSDASAKCQEEHTMTKIELAQLHGRIQALEGGK